MCAVTEKWLILNPPAAVDDIATSTEGPAAVAPPGAVLEAKPERKDDIIRKLERKVHEHMEDSAMLAKQKEFAKVVPDYAP